MRGKFEECLHACMWLASSDCALLRLRLRVATCDMAVSASSLRKSQVVSTRNTVDVRTLTVE